MTIEIDLTQKSDTPIAPSDQPGKKKKKKKPVGGTTTVRKVVDPRTLFLSLNNEEMAHRVAKAITHAVELCGGGEKPEPS